MAKAYRFGGPAEAQKFLLEMGLGKSGMHFVDPEHGYLIFFPNLPAKLEGLEHTRFYLPGFSPCIQDAAVVDVGPEGQLIFREPTDLTDGCMECVGKEVERYMIERDIGSDYKPEKNCRSCLEERANGQVEDAA